MTRSSRVFFAGLAAAFACAPPPDAGRTRPEAVRATPFARS